MSPTLDKLLAAIETLDPTAILKGTSYAKTFNESIGLRASDPFDFVVFIPWGSWETYISNMNKPSPSFPSALEDGFKAVIKNGMLSSDGKDDNKKCFIDITHLDGGSIHDFFSEDWSGNDKPSISDLLVQVINGCDHSITPHVRFLVGLHDTDTKYWASEKSMYEQIFWNNGPPRITHPTAEFHVGIYGPNFEPVSSLTAAARELPQVAEPSNWVETLKGVITEVLQQCGDILGKELGMAEQMIASFEKMASDWITQATSSVNIASVSWNHGKIVAVNGRSLMTGGGNYWPEYLANTPDVFDMQMKLRGDAAIKGHTYADYFWRYLNKQHQTDTQSFCQSTKLCLSQPDWKTNDSTGVKEAVTLYEDMPQGPPATSGVPVLTVAKLGDWFESGGGSEEYPVQIIDALRDIILNILQVMNTAWLPDTSLMPLALDAVSDNQPKIKAALAELNITPAAWASRYARNVAISGAETSVYLYTALLVNPYAESGSPGWDNFVTTLLKTLDLPPTAWNGYLWPFDTLVAFAKALSRCAVSSDPDAGVHIIITQYEPNTLYGDSEPAYEVKNRVASIMKSMAIADQLPVKTNPNDVAKIVDKFFIIKRMLNRNQNVHAKVVCVDKSLLYIGSDNAYTSYNEEFGSWIERQENVQAWCADFWKYAWDNSSLPGPPEPIGPSS